MGIYFKKVNEGFKCALNGEYVGKTCKIEILSTTCQRVITC